VDTVAGGINDRGQIVGNYDDVSGITHGFLLSAGSFSTIDFPGALDLTAPSGITANREIVGFFDDGNGALHGFTLIASNFSTEDFPGAFLTEAFRVNEAGRIVGIYNLAGQHGYLATLTPTRNHREEFSE
jgi:probable HAF family extracellular repeat protein